jgi:hypothetical protein
MPQPEKVKIVENLDLGKTPDKFENSPQDLRNKITSAIDKSVRLLADFYETLEKDQALPKGKKLPREWVTAARNHAKEIEGVIGELKIHLISINNANDNKNKIVEKTLTQLNNLIHKAPEDPRDRPDTTWREFVREGKDRSMKDLSKNPNNPENLVKAFTLLGMEKNGNKETRYLLDADDNKIMKVQKSGDQMFVTKYTKGKPGEAVGYKFTAGKDGKWQITKTGGDGKPEELASVEIRRKTNIDKAVANLKTALNNLKPGEVFTANLIGKLGGERIRTFAKNKDGRIQTLTPNGSVIADFDINNPKTLIIIRATLAQSEFKIKPESEIRRNYLLAEFEKALKKLTQNTQVVVSNGKNKGNTIFTINPKGGELIVETYANTESYNLKKGKKFDPKTLITPNSIIKVEPRDQTA